MNQKELTIKLQACIKQHTALILTQFETKGVFAAVADAVNQALIDGEDVTLPGIGTFSVVEKAERLGRNPQTGEAITIPAHKAVKFKPTSDLKAAIAGSQ